MEGMKGGISLSTPLIFSTDAAALECTGMSFAPAMNSQSLSKL
jgi:hypothetical protein